MNISEINKEIDRLERCETTYNICEKLSVLYACRNNYNNKEEKEVKAYSYSNKSDFIEIAEKADFYKLLNILDEHMDALRVIYPKEYAAIINKINDTI